jgi:stage IV sporulation protein FB
VNLTEPGRTAWDLQFDIAGIPVRVHPLFWLIALFVSGVGETIGIQLVLGVFIVFLSILIHELGHAFTMRGYGERPRVVLYMMGGLAISGGEGVWDLGYRQRQRSPVEQIIISAAGPAAGFALAALTAGVVYATGGTVEFVLYRWIPIVVPFYHEASIGEAAYFSLFLLLNLNVYWGILNLFPVYPMDGGQIARQLFLMRDPWQGLTQSLWLSLIVGAAMAVVGLTQGQLWMGVIFASMAFGSWQMLQNSGHGRRPW